MVTGSRAEGSTGTHMLSANVRKTIQSIREIVGNHSDADIYVALKETNMDPNETTQKLLNQGYFFVGQPYFLLITTFFEYNLCCVFWNCVSFFVSD